MKKILFILLLIINLNVYALEKTEVKLDKCVDGDTAWLIEGAESLKYRFLAVDTPETLHPTKDGGVMGENASEYTCNSLKNATKIEIEYDSNSTKTDKYNRELVWIYIDNILLQNKLVENGYARVEYIYGDYKYVSLLKEAEDIAKENNVGIWGNIYTVTFKYKDFINKVEVIENARVEPINIDEIKGYEFIGWYYNEKPFDFNAPIKNDIELIGKYKENSITIRIVMLIVFLIILFFLDKRKFKKMMRKTKEIIFE